MTEKRQHRRGNHHRVEVRVETLDGEGTFVAVAQMSQGGMTKPQAEALYRHLAAAISTWKPEPTT